MTPTVGRVVHYVSHGTPGGEFGKECRAAIVTQVGKTQGVVGLAVLNPTGLFFQPTTSYDGREHPGGGTWHWPERSDERPKLPNIPAEYPGG